MIKMGLKDQLLSSPTLWHCTHCDTCRFVCPQNVCFSSVVDALREMAVHQGYRAEKDLEKWGTAPCKATCPAHISIPGFVGAIAEGRFEEGLRLIKEEMPFPGICGRICPHPCETNCNRSRLDKPIAIEYLKRFLADVDISKESAYVPAKKPKKKEKVAVIGAGPAGLTVAYYLAREGYGVTVFEKLPIAGGMLAVGIPEFRLPKNILRAEIEVIKKLGVDVICNVEIGKDLGYTELQKKYQAVFIGIGCQRSLKLHIPGEDEWNGVMDGLTFLRGINLGNLPASKGRLIIIGGGNTALDCARTAKRLEYQDVAILYRRSREEMPANPWEVEDAIAEDIDIQYLTSPVKILGENGKVSGLECMRIKLGELDASGRPRPVPIEGSEFMIRTDIVITALGQTPDLTFLPHELALNAAPGGLIRADSQTGLTNVPGLFSGGDVATGPATVVEAIAFGKKAALSIDKYLKGDDPAANRGPDWKGLEYIAGNIERVERQSIPRLALSERKMSFKEIDLGFNREQAKCEAERCFRICGIQGTKPL